MHKPYLIFKFYYTAQAGKTPDPSGDHVVTNLLGEILKKPISKSLKFDFMRYSADGYHLYLRIRGSQEQLESLAAHDIPSAINNYIDEFPEKSGSVGNLGEYSMRLHKRLGIDESNTKAAGSHSFQWSKEDTDLYEDEKIYFENLVFNDDFSRALVNLLSKDIEVQALKLFVRLLLTDLLLASRLSDEDRFYLLYFVQKQWIQFFGIEDETLKSCTINADRSKNGFYKFLDNTRDYKCRASALPAHIREDYKACFESLLPTLNKLIQRDKQGVVTNQTALRIISLIHLCHNRVGFDINQEITFSILLNDFCKRNIDGTRVKELLVGADLNIDHYVGNLNNLSESA